MSVVAILTHILLTLLTSIGLSILQRISLCHRWFLFGVSYYVNFQFTPWRLINGYMVSKIWVGMSTTNIFIYPNSNSKPIAKTRTLNLSTSEPIQKKTRPKFLTLHSPFCLFLIKILKLNCHREYFRVFFSWWNHQMHFKMVHSNTKNAKSRVF